MIVVEIFVGEDHREDSRIAHSAGHARERSGGHQRRLITILFGLELPVDLAAPKQSLSPPTLSLE